LVGKRIIFKKSRFSDKNRPEFWNGLLNLYVNSEIRLYKWGYMAHRGGVTGRTELKWHMFKKFITPVIKTFIFNKIEVDSLYLNWVEL